jgi:glyoxylase-like metal-dependent hydrolase (beta-lactamase superfamily II)
MLVLHANNASPWTGPSGNSTYLLRGRVPSLIDAGTGDEGHLQSIESALQGKALARVFITHSHPDHVGGLERIRERWPLVEAIRFGHHENIVEAGDTRLRILPTPGHAPDHLCFFDEESRDLYCGDLARMGGSIVVPASKGGNLRDYLDSLKRMRALEPRRLLPGHGAIVDDPATLIDDYLRHRQQREDEIVAAVGNGLRTPEQIVPKVYGVLSPMLMTAAADSVLAHLVKLHDEGRAFVSDDGWRLM